LGRLRGNALLLLASTLFALGAAELVLRALAEQRSVVRPDGERKTLFNAYRSDERLSYAFRPGWVGTQSGSDFRVAVAIDARGMRSVAEPVAAPVARLLVLGDSFAYGWGVEASESFAGRLAERWRDAGRPVEVLDAAVPGYSADQYWISLRDRGFALAPDAILLALSQNDADDLAWNRLAISADGLPIRTASLRRFIDQSGRMHYLNEDGRALPDFDAPFSAWLAERSLLYTYVRYNALRLWLGAAERRSEARRAQEAGPAPEAAIETLAPDAIARGLASSESFRLRYHRFLIDAIRREAARRGVRVFTAVTGSGVGDLSGDCARDPDCLDLAAALPQPSHPDAYLPLDGHWSARGHELAADALYAFLAGRAFPPAR
jgi:hypothetical protein